ncbi:23S rRNA (uracil(1939)-C(5))-methyltransferase RlmD [Roseofilum casamattae]|uniref:23S rRNA (Uracil(1939)-C(5))-methyltransferase RlmD n=1 Tax=Roseofilum casamattae BLCC-M143 TaxID=3022442 RepID=A0ABT7BTZ6_9CYAN|nr:23S rRNA (uracil(1939)-C(5))-methyltransferase RlmD [Roseofilum casamattae]MDJ1182656.1 23S rRNA (uracil(1939)-C(5))-methyltransferase RlmD [Roseofilum casamattae BLCC-M143]
MLNKLKTDDGWQQGQIVELEIASLSDTGDGVGRVEGRVVFVPDSVPGDRLMVRLTQVKRQFARGAIAEIIVAGGDRIRPQCIVADKCGGCQWQHIDYGYQHQAKQGLVKEALTRIGQFSDPPVDLLLPNTRSLGYRNKVSYPLGISATGNVKAGYYQKSSHKIVNLNQCPVQDERLNPLLSGIKIDIQQAGWSIYNERTHRGLLRHLCLRIGERTGEILVTLVATSAKLPELENYAQQWLNDYPGLVGVCLNINPHKTNRIFADETQLVAGQPYLYEKFSGLTLQLGADTFFQVNTTATEALLEVILKQLNLSGMERAIDAYCGIGTLTLPLARHLEQIDGIEVQPEAIEQAQTNAQLNQIENANFHVGKVETILPKLEINPDLVILDPPRQGCHASVLNALLESLPQHIVYVSCKPSTLARDLKILCQSGTYRLVRVQPADFFPQTAHVEAVSFLEHQ